MPGRDVERMQPLHVGAALFGSRHQNRRARDAIDDRRAVDANVADDVEVRCRDVGDRHGVTAGGLVKSLIQSGDGDALLASNGIQLVVHRSDVQDVVERPADRHASHIQGLRVDCAIDGIRIELAELMTLTFADVSVVSLRFAPCAAGRTDW